MLDDFYFADPRVALIPIEQLSPDGVDPAFAAVLCERIGWSDHNVELLDEGLALYWQRLSALARRGRDLSPPRLRNVAVVLDPDAVRPYAPLLNVSTWTTYACDFDPAVSDPELVAYLLAHADRMSDTGEVTLAAIHLAAWWFERDAEERAAFVAAAAASPRPDAATYRAIADALPWLRELRHEKLRPPRKPGGHRAIPGTGLLVPRASEHEPDRLLIRCRDTATATLGSFVARWRDPDETAATELVDWLAGERPPLLVTGRRGSIVWDPDAPAQVDAIRGEIAPAGARPLRDVLADLRLVAAHTTTFLAALRDPHALPSPDPHAAQSGYSYMHAGRRLIAYNLHESGIERLVSPALPYARPMLGARTVHEWAHLGVDGGLVPRTLDDDAWRDLLASFAALLDDTIRRAPRAVRDRSAPDLRVLARDGTPGAALAAVFASRLPDYRSNLLAQRFLDVAEREAYVRQNIRPLGREFQPAEIWRLLVRALYELQYLRFSAIDDPRTYFLRTTWLERDLVEPGALDLARFDELAEVAGRICAAHAVDESRLHPVTARG